MTQSRMTVLDPAPPELWDRVCNTCSYATFFHTRTWAELLVKAFPECKPATRAYIFDNGTVAVLPLIERQAGLKGFFRSYESVAPGVYGGLIADGDLSPAQVESVYRSLRDGRTAQVTVIGNPYAPWTLPEAFRTSLLFTQSLRLDGEFKDVWQNFSRGNRSNIRKALRSNLAIDIAQREEDYWEYYNAYQETLRRWGPRATSRYPAELFLALRTCDPAQARLWLVRKSGVIIGGIVVFYHQRHAVYWHGAFIAAFFEYRPSNLVHAEAIRDACARGFQWYDFNPSGGHAGVVRFKQSFHPQVLYFHAVTIPGSRWYHLYARWRNRLLGTWSRAKATSGQDDPSAPDAP
ncbi:MAG TPA: GNAT family N-acetyltransferase [Blastocatellia bacterium]|nr:GNAT family N-acetyltransferase [Blastocatellia bacterium]